MVQGQPEDQGGRQVYRQVYRVRRERVRGYARDCGKENFPFLSDAYHLYMSVFFTDYFTDLLMSHSRSEFPLI